MRGRFSLNTNNMAAFSACSSALVAITCGSAYGDGSKVVFFIGFLPRGGPPTSNLQYVAIASIVVLRRLNSSSKVVPGRVRIVSTKRLCGGGISSVDYKVLFTSSVNLRRRVAFRSPGQDVLDPTWLVLALVVLLFVAAFHYRSLGRGLGR